MQQPVFWHSTPPEMAEEFIHGFMGDGGAVIDLTPGDGKWALMALRHRKPYMGVTFTKHHKEALGNRLDHLIFNAMQDEKDPLFTGGLADVLKPDAKGKDGKGKDSKSKDSKDGKGKDKSEDGINKKKSGKKQSPEQGADGEGTENKKAGGASVRTELMKRLSSLSGAGRKAKRARKAETADEDDDEDEAEDSEPEDSDN